MALRTKLQHEFYWEQILFKPRMTHEEKDESYLSTMLPRQKTYILRNILNVAKYKKQAFRVSLSSQMGKGCLSHFAVIKHYGKGRLGKSLFELMVPEGLKSILAGRRGNRQQPWQQEQETELSAHVFNCKLEPDRQLTPGQGFECSEPQCVSSNKATPPIGNQVSKCLSLWGTFLTQTTTTVGHLLREI